MTAIRALSPPWSFLSLFLIPARPDPGSDFSSLNDAMEAWARMGSTSSLVSVVSTYTSSSPASVLVSAPSPVDAADSAETSDALSEAVRLLEQHLKQEGPKPELE
jgi:hypothetical protein